MQCKGMRKKRMKMMRRVKRMEKELRNKRKVEDISRYWNSLHQ
jgi:hypothetical protein